MTMEGLAKAKLVEIGTKPNGKPTGKKVEVQFNPESLKLTLSNANEGGKSRGRQRRQFVGKSSTELSFDLIFDTADELSGGQARSVTERTKDVERFVLPKGNSKKKQAPARVRFHWGNLIFDGVISNLTVNFELFSPDGIPLRAKMGITIKEQDASYQYLESGPGANLVSATPDARGGGAAAGQDQSGDGATDRTERTIEGETLAEFAVRVGLDPLAWRRLASQVLDPLSLPAGQLIDFNSAGGSPAQLGVRVGIEADITASVDAAFGLAVSEAGSVAAGLALAAAGGLNSAMAQATIVKAETSAAAARAAFEAPTLSAATTELPVGVESLPSPSRAIVLQSVGTAAALAPKPFQTEQAREPLTAGIDSGGRLNRAPIRPAVDRRAATFGIGVPLRPQVRGAAIDRSGLVGGNVSLGPSRPLSDVLTPGHPSDPPWERIPRGDVSRAAADKEQGRRKPKFPCCSGVHAKSGGSR